MEKVEAGVEYALYQILKDTPTKELIRTLGAIQAQMLLDAKLAGTEWPGWPDWIMRLCEERRKATDDYQA